MASSTTVPALKDEDAAHSVATAWRATLCDIVRAFVAKDYTLRRRPTSVAPVGPAVADQIREYIADYGETLVEVPDDTWNASVSQRMGDHWQVLVDLWTVESGESDMAMSVRVFEIDGGFRVELDSVHVP